MKKQLWVVLLAIVMVMSLIACVACKNDPATYTLTYAAGEGSGTAPEVESYKEGETVTIKANPFTAPANKEFDGWSDGTTKYQANGTLKMPAANVTLTAQWKDKSTVIPKPDVTLESISAAYDGTIEVNGSIDKTKLTVTASYSDQSSKEVTDYILGTIDTSEAGGAQVIITYKEGEITKTFTLTITIVQPDTPIQQHTVTFDPGNGEDTWTVSVNDGETVARPETDPVHPDGKTFRYWTNNSGEYDFTAPISRDIEITASYAWKVTFLAGTGAIGTIDSQWVSMWTARGITLPEATGLSNGDKVFAGWSDGEQTYQAGDTYVGQGNVTLTAQWSEAVASDKYTLTFTVGSHGAGTPPAARQLSAGETTVLPDGTGLVLDEGYENEVFLGWSTNWKGNPLLLAGSTYTMPAENVTLQAIWGEDPEKPIIEPNGAWIGTFDVVEDDEYEYELVIALDSDGKTLLITFDGDEATNISIEVVNGNQQITFDIANVLMTSTYIITLEANGSFTFNDAEYYFDYTIEKRVQKYTVTYIKSTNESQISNIVGNVPAAAEVAEGSVITMPAANTLTLDHYTLTAWRVFELVIPSDGSDAYWTAKLDADNKAINIAPGAEFTMIGSNIRLCGVWTANTVTINFNANGGSGEIASVTNKQYNSTYLLPTTCAFTAPAGMKFAGWSTSADGDLLDGGLKLDSAVVSAEDTVTIYAIWKSTTETPTTPLIDDIKGAWAAESHTLDIIAGSDAANESIKGYAVLDGKYFLVVLADAGNYYAYSLDYSLFYTVSLSEGSLILTSDAGNAITLSDKTELVNVDRVMFEGNWNKESVSTITGTTSTQPWVITANAVYYNASMTKASINMVIGKYFVISYDQAGYSYVYVLEKKEVNLEGWYIAPEYVPAATTFVPADFLTLTVQGEINQIVNAGATPNASKIEAPQAPEGKEFAKWVIAGTETEFDLTAAMTESVSIEAVFQAKTSQVNTYIGNVTIDGIFGAKYTFTRFDIDFDALTISGIVSSGEECTITIANAKHPNYKPNTYGDSSLYYDVIITIEKSTLNTHFVVNAEQTKLSVCDDDDNVLNNGEFILQTAESTSWKPLSATDSNCDLYKLAQDADIRLYFDEPFENGGIKFLGIEFNVHSVLGVRIKGVYESNGEEKVPASYLSYPTQSEVNVAWLVYHSTAYDIVIGEKEDGKFYVVSFKYGSNNTEYDTTERVLGEKPSTPPVEETASLTPYNGTYIGDGIMINGYNVVYVMIDGDSSITLMDDEEDYFTSNISEIKKVDGLVVATFEQGTLTVNADGSITVTVGSNSATFTK